MNKPSKDSSQAKSKFLVDMSREIQMAMKDIMGHSDIVRKTKLSAEQEKHINAIYISAQKLSWVVNDIMDFSQLETGQVELQSIDFDLEYLMQSAVQFLNYKEFSLTQGGKTANGQ